MTSRRQTTSIQRWNIVVYLNVGIYNVEQRRINVVYLDIALNNFRQRRNNVAISNVNLRNVEPRRNNVVNMSIKKMKNKLGVKNIIILLSFNKNNLNWIH